MNMTPSVDDLIAAWVRWERHPRSETTANAKCDAIDALDLPASAVHRLVADARRTGFDVPSAVQSAVCELGYRPTATHLKEAS